MCIYSIFITEASGYFNGGNKRAMKVLTTDIRHEIHNFLIHSDAR